LQRPNGVSPELDPGDRNRLSLSLESEPGQASANSVDLIYLDPPFNSNASYNVLLKAPDGHQSRSALVFWPGSW
jgi:16S rRNA G966 N2-methylase RsmD